MCATTPAATATCSPDRGTFNYLQSTGAVSNRKVVTRDLAPTAMGGAALLVNSFHADALNPAKFATKPKRHRSAATTASSRS